MMDQPQTEPADRPRRKPRADAARNRERVLDAAKAVFSADAAASGKAGADKAGGSLEAVARVAGVGIGTLYRHFPTRDALFEAVYRREVEQLTALADQLGALPDPVAALRCWMRANVEFIATKKGMLAALTIAAQSKSEMTAFSTERLTRAVAGLLGRAVVAGKIRADIGPDDLLRTLVGLCILQTRPGWQSNVLRLVDVFVDGLRLAEAR
jgi:AcrR family transcriptional regulator